MYMYMCYIICEILRCIHVTRLDSSHARARAIVINAILNVSTFKLMIA